MEGHGGPDPQDENCPPNVANDGDLEPCGARRKRESECHSRECESAAPRGCLEHSTTLPKRSKPAQCNRDLLLARAEREGATEGAQRLCQRCHLRGLSAAEQCRWRGRQYTCVVCGGTYCAQCATSVLCRRRYVWVWYGYCVQKRSRRGYVWRRRDAEVRWAQSGPPNGRHWAMPEHAPGVAFLVVCLVLVRRTRYVSP